MAQRETARQDRLSPPGVYGKLKRLRALLRARLAAEGLAWLLVSLVAAVFLTLALDRMFRLDDRAQRAIVAAVAMAGALYVAWREILAPLQVPMNAEALALLVERRYGQLGDRLISAIQFSLSAHTEGMSPAMMARTAAEAETIAGPLDFRRVVERRRMRNMLMMAACAIGLLGGFSVWQQDMMGLWFQRNVLFADVPWPQRTYLEVLHGPDFTVLRGEDLTVEVALRPGSVPPPHVTLYRLYPSVGRPSEDRVERSAGPSDTYVKVVRAVNEPFEFYVTGGDDQTDRLTPHKVRVIDPPAIRRATFTVEYPSYANVEPRRFFSGEVLSVPYGGRLRVEAVANKPLASAEIYLDDQKVWPAPGARLPGTEGGQGFVAEFAPPCENRLVSRTLKFVLTDSAGYRSRDGQEFAMQVLPDDPPSVEIAKVGGLADIQSVTPDVKLPLRLTVKDNYGIGMVGLSGAQDALVAKTAAQLGLPVDEVKRRYRLPAARLRAHGEGALLLEEQAEKLLPDKVQVHLDHTQVLALRGKARAGQSVRIDAQAQDNRTAEFKGPGVGKSKALDFEVVEAAVMSDKLLGRQKKAAEDFAAATQLQASAYAKSAAAADSEAFRTEGPATAVRAGLAGSAGAQRAVGDACAQAADVFRGIVEEGQYNGIGEPEEHAAFTQGVVLPLRALTVRCGDAAVELGRIVDEMSRASSLKDTKLADDVAKIAREQQAILEEMKSIGRSMEKLRSLQAMADRVQRLIRWVQELHKEIEAQRTQGLEGIFRP